MKKKLLVAVLAILMLGAFAACSITQVSAMAFSVAPASYYKVDDSVDAGQFTVQVDMEDGSSREFALTNSLLTVQGLVDGKLDTSTAGQKTLRISYRGFSFTFTYTVLGGGAMLPAWTSSAATAAEMVEGKAYTGTFSATTAVTVDTAEELAGFMVLCNGLGETYTGTLTLAANIDLGGNQWVPIKNFGGTFNGNNYTVSNLTIINTNNQVNMENQGLFGEVSDSATFQNVTLDGFYIEETNNQAMTSKNYGALIGAVGNVPSIEVTVDNVTVTNATLKGTARLGGIIGYVYSNSQVVKVSNCYVQGSFTSINPVTVTTEDGEGDKVGGIIGQANGQNQTITNCTVLVQLAGTRDIGGIVGFLNNGTVSGCTVLNGSTLRASVAGGMLITKGTRNVGGIIGSVQGIATLGEENEVEDGVIMETNSMYDYSNHSTLFGGFRAAGCVFYRDMCYSLTKNAENNNYAVFTEATEDRPADASRYNTSENKTTEAIEAFMKAQTKAQTELNSAYSQAEVVEG